MKYVIAALIGLALLATGAYLYFGGIMYPLEFVSALLLGWVRFLVRTVPEMSLSVSGSIAAWVCLLLIIVATHRLCGWLFRHNQNGKIQSSAAAPRRWHWRWTLALVALVMLMFVAGLAAVGITHQTSWLALSPEPIIGPSETWADRMEATNNLKLIGITVHSHNDAMRRLPPGGTFDEQGNGLHSWMTLIMPYGLADNSVIDQKIPWNHPKNQPIFKKSIWMFRYPGSSVAHDDEGYGVSHYASNVHVIGGSKALKLTDITDGAENTIMIGQAIDNLKPWGQPINWRDPALGINQSPNGFGNAPRTGALVLMADGHVKFLPTNTSPAVLKALSTPAAGD